MKHDSSRIIQTCLKYGDLEMRLKIHKELKGCFVDLSKSQYAKNIILKLMEYW
jgi:pumilio family protein 6